MLIHSAVNLVEVFRYFGVELTLGLVNLKLGLLHHVVLVLLAVGGGLVAVVGGKGGPWGSSTCSRVAWRERPYSCCCDMSLELN